jgi:hypothetical protein
MRGLSGGQIAGGAHIGQFCVGPVDRRFNRVQCGADPGSAAFAAGLKRDAVDLDPIRDDLAAVVHLALEAAHVAARIRRRLMLASAATPPSSSLYAVMRFHDDAVRHEAG